LFKAATRAAGLPEDCVFHGLRKTAAVRLAEAGCTTEQIKSITGHRTDQMAAYYAKRANQRLLAKAAIGRLAKKIAQP
jgi:integrase